MVEDLLTHDERRRLEALSQAISLSSVLGAFAQMMGGVPTSPEGIIELALRFDQWIAGDVASEQRPIAGRPPGLE
jgi:hypothetical protein